MKKIFLAAISLLLTLPAFAETFQYTYEGKTLNYETISDNECEVSNNPGISGAVAIPKKVICNDREYTVTKVGERAFEKCDSLTSITIPNSVISIEGHAFEKCNSLESIIIPNSVTSIEGQAFDYSALKSITIPNSVTYIGEGAFKGCSKLESIDLISVPLVSLESYVFAYCHNLKSVSLPSSLKSIGIRVFTDCSSLESITIPNSVTSIELNAFLLCSSLKSVSLPPSSLTTIGKGVFSNCSNLESITIPNSVTSIGEQAFDFSGLKSITIPNSVTTIGILAFQGCTALSSITLGSELKTIAKSAFYRCSNLKKVTCLALIPPTVVTDQWAFSPKNCTLYVAFMSWPAYMISYGWKDFGCILPISNMGTATSDDLLTVSASNGCIAIENAPVGSTVVVKDIHNATVANEVIKDANQTISLNRKGIFIVNVDDATYKVAL